MQTLRLILLAAGLALALWQDLRRGRIPNPLNLGLAAAGLALALAEGRPLWALAGFAAGAAAGVGGWLLGVFRAGDAKLFMALGALMGPRWLGGCFGWSLAVGAALGLALLLRKRQLLARLRRVRDHLKLLVFTRSYQAYQPLPGTEREFPLAVSIALGSLLACLVPLF